MSYLYASSVDSSDSQDGGSFCHQRSEEMYACSICEDVLRAVPAWKVLRCFGAVLRQSGGDEDSYGLSRPTKRINTFWSHSWRGCSRHKLCSLYFVYNRKTAVISSLLVCILMGALVQADVVEGKWCFKSECASQGDCNANSFCGVNQFNGTMCLSNGFCCVRPDCPGACTVETRVPFRHWPFFAGGVAYFVVLVLWQPGDLVFLYKVCIHQTDIVRKRRGIDGLGGFLRSSQEMMLLWDATYFTRLWCNFELAAFTYLRGAQARIRIFPSLRGHVIIMATVGGFVFEACQACLGHSWHAVSAKQAMYMRTLTTMLKAVSTICFGTWLAHMARLYAREHRDMKKQMQGFRCESAECFCCSVGHVIPGTTTSIECDREAIYGAIRMWFPGGTDEFDAIVRDIMPTQVERNIGASVFRFTDSFYLTLPTWWAALSDNAAESCWDSWTWPVTRLVLDLLLSWAIDALQMASIVWMATYAQTKRTHLDAGVSFIIAIMCGLLREGQEWVCKQNIVGSSYSVLVLFISSQVVIANALFSGVNFRSRKFGDRSLPGSAHTSSQGAHATIEMLTR